MKNNKILIYIITLLVISYLAEIYILMNGGIDSKAFNNIAPLIMFLPAILTVLYLIITKEGLKSINWKIGKPIYLFYAAIIPASLALFAALLISFFGWGTITHFHFLQHEVIITKGKFVLGKGRQSISYFILNYFITMLVFSIITGALTFGEELGWRGFLQKKLIAKRGLFWGIVILGLIWGFWHFPLIVSGYNYPEFPKLGAFFLFPLTTVFASFFLAWLTLKANSFWPAVIAHGSVNAFIGSILAGMNYGNNRLFADIFVLCIWGIIAFFSYLSIKNIGSKSE
ncbi:MAG TPA: CPBP family intramembrane glutamic endopeptidase [Puia sp.]|nr:CPBP family intramembrane glutamic endopeptidase [Puia sp.]